MVRKGIVLLRMAVLAFLAVIALLSATAWLANFRIPFAVLQTIGLVDKGAVVGESWNVEWLLQEDDQRSTWLNFGVRLQTLRVHRTVFYATNPGPTDFRTLDFGPIRYCRWGRDDLQSFRCSQVEIALWLIWPLVGAWPVWAFVHGPLTRWHRRRHGRCLHCGYDLTGLTEPRCPECGNGVVLGHVTPPTIPVSSNRL